MQRSQPSSTASRAVGALLALAAALSALSIARAMGGPAGSLSLLATPGLLLFSTFSWAAIFVPLWLASASLLAFLPGFRPRAVFALIASLLPFLVLTFFARFASDPSPVFAAFPALEALGLPALGFFCFLFILFLALLAARLALRFFPAPEEGPFPERNPAPPRRLLSPLAPSYKEGAPVAAPRRTVAETDEEGVFDFVVPVLPPPPHLHSADAGPARRAKEEVFEDEDPSLAFPEGYEGGDETLSESAAEDGDGAEEEGQAPHQPASAALPLSENTPEAEEPIPLWFGERRKTGAATVEIGAAHAAHAIEFTSVPPGQGGTIAVPAQSAAAAQGLDEAEEAAREELARRILARRQPKPWAVGVEGLLNTYPDGQYWIIDDKTRKSAEVLQETLAEFNIKAEVTGIRKGPVITMFEILPAPGVRLSKIANLADNIALRLAASSVRIVAPIPGKHAVGIEVPNERRSIVSLREIVENEAFKTTKMEIPVVLGKDIAGEAQFIDLVQTPHLLIAGATGSGKSVSVNSIILSILFRRSPEEVRLILIDPKIVELKLYNDVPHLLTPVITEPKRAFQALQYCICEMERRYSMLDRLGVRDIKSYNRKIKEKGFVQERLPYIVVIIDEFADLMATTGKELESTLARLAAMSRAVGIHLVLATQRPSIDVITGLIKANIPSRIAFMVASKFDSRIIIDMVGAEKLLGRGDMLFASAWDPFPIRMQGAFVSEEEVEKSVAFMKTLGEPDYIDEEIFIDEDEEDEGPTLFDDADGDPLFEQALEIVLAQGKASASYLQRKLKVGYNRAARIVELMEERGIVGPAQGSKPRILVRNPEITGRSSEAGRGSHGADGADFHPGASRDRVPSLLADLETVPGQRVTGRDEED